MLGVTWTNPINLRYRMGKSSIDFALTRVSYTGAAVAIYPKESGWIGRYIKVSSIGDDEEELGIESNGYWRDIIIMRQLVDIYTFSSHFFE